MNPEIRPAGDRGSLIEVADNPTAVRLARVLRAKHSELVDVVVGHRTVLVTWGNESFDLGDLVLAPEPEAAGRLVEIPVVYEGPDLDEVAALTGLSPEAVIVLHTGAEHVAAFVGFQPGFAYLTGGDERLHVPRREVPRTLVPGGAVAIAGPYSGVYPRDSPGGWRLLGSTATSMFDPARDRPALLAPGDRVRFIAV